jgi:tetratricopeptide (TPR) repeat protein
MTKHFSTLIWHGGAWRYVNAIFEAGLIDEPVSDEYVLGMIHAFVDLRRTQNECQPATLLEDDRIESRPRTLETTLWRLFEVEGGGEISLANHDQILGRKGLGNWAFVLWNLVFEGKIDRDRTLTASLEALNRGFSQFRAGWFSRFHEQLAPTLDERAARLQHYLDLLASPIPPTVSFAIKALQKLQKAKRLPADLLLQHIEPALYSQTANIVKTALAMLAQALKSGLNHGSEGVQLAAIALEHQKPDVQSKAWEIIEKNGAKDDENLRVRIQGSIELVAAGLKPQLLNWLGVESAQRVEDEKLDLDTLKSRASELDRNLAKRANIEVTLQALSTLPRQISATLFDGTDIPRLRKEDRLDPIQSAEEFIEEALIALEHLGDYSRAERIFEAVMRLDVDWQAVAAELTPLVTRLERFNKTERQYGFDAGVFVALPILLNYLCGLSFSPKCPLWDPQIIFVVRTTEIIKRLKSNERKPLLSAATHAGRWIDPVVLVERSKTPGLPGVGLADQVLALLRLAPDNRKQALKQARSIPGEWGVALRYALGRKEVCGQLLPLWIAACRARSPFQNDENIRALLDNSYVGADLAPSYNVRHQLCRSSFQGIEYVTPDTKLNYCDTVFECNVFQCTTPTIALSNPKNCLSLCSHTHNM